jgi:hypothetical protein
MSPEVVLWILLTAFTVFPLFILLLATPRNQ